LIANSYFAGHDCALRLLAAREEPLLHEEEIQAGPFGLRYHAGALLDDAVKIVNICSVNTVIVAQDARPSTF
jgi:hypothetical protein